MTTLREAVSVIEHYAERFKPLVASHEELIDVTVWFDKEHSEDMVYLKVESYSCGERSTEWISFPLRLADETTEVIKTWMEKEARRRQEEADEAMRVKAESMTRVRESQERVELARLAEKHGYTLSKR